VEATVGPWSAPGRPRDIYYLVFDRYGSEANLRERFGFDNSAFTRDLERRGFYVARDSRANHLKTAQSLASSLNLRYLDGLAERHGADTGNLLPVYELLQEHTVGRLLRERGYDYVHIGAWWDPTQANRHAVLNLGYEQRSDFQVLLYDTTLLSELGTRPSDKTADQHRRVHYDGALSQFRHLREVAQRPGPTFTFAHILLPHEPFVFDRDGNFVPLADEPVRGHTRNYVEQTQFTNGRIDALLDTLLDVPPAQAPIIVIQADEGPHPLRYKADEDGFDWEQASDAELREKFWILNAYHLPGVGAEAPLYPSISPVNTWRVIFNTYFGADLPLLDDRSFIYRDSRHVYDFTEVTDRVR
ncbi:MAG: LTA synthase family protein, partial [Actinomycetota bacterium]|nr:LTA synthase family protein [Actinomycetota bacterium]